MPFIVVGSLGSGGLDSGPWVNEGRLFFKISLFGMPIFNSETGVGEEERTKQTPKQRRDEVENVIS